MDFDFYYPTELGELLAFWAAAFTIAIGLVITFAPGYALRLFSLQLREGRTEGWGEMRSLGGFYVGFGVTALLFAQTWIYLALGISFAVSAFARLISILSDKGSSVLNYLLLVVQVILAALPLMYVFGYV